MISPEVKTSIAMQELAKAISESLMAITGEDMGFMLMVFNTTNDARTNYISNCDREEVIDSMKFLLDKWADGLPDIPAHEVN